MDLNEFIDNGRPRWERLSRLLDRIEGEGLKALSLDEAREFGRLTASDDGHAGIDRFFARQSLPLPPRRDG